MNPSEFRTELHRLYALAVEKGYDSEDLGNGLGLT